MGSRIFPVILCGGSGTRLWPMSRKLLPKQFLPLVSERSMLQDTVLRIRGIPNLESPAVVCNEEHRFVVAEQLRELGVSPWQILLEPAARNTAPAVAAAALAVSGSDPDAIMLVVPADSLIRDAAAFRAAVEAAVAAAGRGFLATFGVVPTSAETGYGYIERGARLEGLKASGVARFVEKPDRATAEGFVASGRFLWNSGTFVFAAAVLLRELDAFRPDIAAAARKAWEQRAKDMDFTRLGAEAFAACPAESVDRAVMERTQAAAVVEAEMGWSDVGSWATLWSVAAKDAEGNVVRGDADVRESRNSYVRADSRLVSVIGVADLVIVETSDAVLVAHRDKAQSVKEAVSRLEERNRSEHLHHRRVYRPWGYYETVDTGEGFQVKRIMVKPGEALSLQLHQRRAEHWVVVSGTARVTRGDDTFRLEKNQSTYIPPGTRHRLENAEAEALHLIEVQSGDYLGEDDIVRFEDRYRRS
jgi:mannose-1-phosphate guanylyltransferase / mannose-6-phosphate isomerase